LLLDNGLVLSCSYDKTIMVWSYRLKVPQLEHFTITKQEELRCLEYLPEEATLLIGTNSGSILSQKIDDILNWDDNEDPMMIEMGDMSDWDGQEQEEDPDDYMNGKTLDENYEEILRLQ